MVGKRVGNQLEQQSTRSQSENEFTQHATLTIIQFVIHTSLRHYFSTGIIKEQRCAFSCASSLTGVRGCPRRLFGGLPCGNTSPMLALLTRPL